MLAFELFWPIFSPIPTEYGVQILEQLDQKTPNTDTFQVVSASILSVISKYLEVKDQTDNYEEDIIKVLTGF